MGHGGRPNRDAQIKWGLHLQPEKRIAPRNDGERKYRRPNQAHTGPTSRYGDWVRRSIWNVTKGGDWALGVGANSALTLTRTYHLSLDRSGGNGTVSPVGRTAETATPYAT